MAQIVTRGLNESSSGVGDLRTNQDNLQRIEGQGSSTR